MNDGTKAFGIGITYEMAPNPPAPMEWEDYEQRVMFKWNALLDSVEGCVERKIHNFLAQHPSMIPGQDSITDPQHGS